MNDAVVLMGSDDCFVVVVAVVVVAVVVAVADCGSSIVSHSLTLRKRMMTSCSLSAAAGQGTDLPSPLHATRMEWPELPDSESDFAD